MATRDDDPLAAAAGIGCAVALVCAAVWIGLAVWCLVRLLGGV